MNATDHIALFTAIRNIVNAAQTIRINQSQMAAELKKSGNPWPEYAIENCVNAWLVINQAGPIIDAMQQKYSEAPAAEDSTFTYEAVKAKLCEGCRKGLQSTTVQGGPWKHVLNGDLVPCTATDWRRKAGTP